jgi:hypothetical protein
LEAARERHVTRSENQTHHKVFRNIVLGNGVGNVLLIRDCLDKQRDVIGFVRSILNSDENN